MKIQHVLHNDDDDDGGDIKYMLLCFEQFK